MLKHCLSFLLFAIAIISSAIGQVAPGENLILNGTLEADQIDFPIFWICEPSSAATYFASGGPEDKAYIALKPAGDGVEIKLRQQGLKLVAGEQYKISAWIKTKDFSSNHHGFVVHNDGWYQERGIRRLPRDSDWQLWEETFTMMASNNGTYGVVAFAVRMQGEMAVADLKLEAVSPAAQQGSRSSEMLLSQTRPQLVPWQPLLNHIPIQNPQLTMRFFGYFVDGLPADRDFVYALGNGPAVRKPLHNQSNIVDLQGLPLGDHQLTVSIQERNSNQVLYNDQYTVTLIDLPAIDTSNHRRLNNLVTELAVMMIADNATQTMTFDNPRDGWIYLACQGAADRPQMQVSLASGTTLITAATDGHEAFRWLPVGRHQLVARGSAGCRLVVRAVPVLFNYPPCANNHLPENPAYDWEWQKRHVLPAVNTLNGGNIPEQHRAEVRERGLIWLANLGSTKLQSTDDLLARFARNPGMKQPWYDGVTCDEQFFSQPALNLYTEGLRQVDNPDNRLIYTWIVGKPSLPGVHNAFISNSVNASRGHGKLIYEAYCRPRQTEESAAAYLQEYVVDTINRFNIFYPDASASSGIIFGNFNQIPILSLDHNPEIDSKYYLDMQLNLVANNPAFTNLGVTGYWGTYYADEEYNRWSFRLLRHYGVEGNTEMLSTKHGFQYRPGHLQNADFINGLTAWEVQPAAANAVRVDQAAGFGKASQGRWGGTAGVGDHVCIMKRQAGQPNRVSQTATGLQVGKIYTLQFVTADWQDIVNKKTDPKRFGIDVQLSDGAKIIPEKTYVHVDKRVKGRYAHNTGVARINLHHLTFQALQKEVTLTFHDQDATPGQELAFNYVMLKPYYEVE